MATIKTRLTVKLIPAYVDDSCIPLSSFFARR